MVSIKLAQRDVSSIVPGGIASLDDLSNEAAAGVVDTSRAVLFILSRDSLLSQRQLLIIKQVMQLVEEAHGVPGKAPAVILATLPDFQFPGDDYFSYQLPLVWQGEEAVAPHVRALLRSIAVTLTTGAADELLDVQMSQIMARIPRVPRVLSRPPGEQMAANASGQFTSTVSGRLASGINTMIRVVSRESEASGRSTSVNNTTVQDAGCTEPEQLDTLSDTRPEASGRQPEAENVGGHPTDNSASAMAGGSLRIGRESF
mmetsp:Transcript_59515/g.177086  ORF Transcript_59515/g.177086 Transcript_59515/m.177086 type:complete len:259 (-) Transcript_59515:160-936(-)